MAILVPRRRVTQPSGLCPIDWGNPITRGLVFCGIPHGTTFIDAVTKVPGVVTGSLVTAVRPPGAGKSYRGDGISIAGTGTNTDKVVWPVSLLRGGSITSSGTILGLAGSTEQVDGKWYAVGGNTESTNGFGFSLGIDSYLIIGRGPVTRGRYANPISSSSAVTVGNPFDNRTHFFGYSFNSDGANGTWFADRRGEAWSGSTQVFNASTTLNRSVSMLAPSDTGNNGNRNAYVLMMLIFEREVTLEEYQALYDNPWQVFEPKRILLPDAGAAPAGYVRPRIVVPRTAVQRASRW